jgi:hypothetical protein
MAGYELVIHNFLTTLNQFQRPYTSNSMLNALFLIKIYIIARSLFILQVSSFNCCRVKVLQNIRTPFVGLKPRIRVLFLM